MRFRLRRSIMETEVEVTFESLDELESALGSLREMTRAVQIEDAQKKATELWEHQENHRQVPASIIDSGERIALSLLSRWPNAVRNADIVSDTGLSRAGVYDNLVGRRGNKADWFRDDGELYHLSNIGEDEVIRLVSERVKRGE